MWILYHCVVCIALLPVQKHRFRQVSHHIIVIDCLLPHPFMNRCSARCFGSWRVFRYRVISVEESRRINERCCSHQLVSRILLVNYLFTFECVVNLLRWWLQQVPCWCPVTANKTDFAICCRFKCRTLNIVVSSAKFWGN